jgi:enoyl-CoA hydratase
MSEQSKSPLRWHVEPPVGVITLARPEAANAQNAAMLTALLAAIAEADRDDTAQVVLVEAEGKHFSAGHDLKELFAGEEPWAAMRATAEGKLRHEQELYWEPMVRLRDLRKVTVAAVQGTCSAAGLMLACMCDLIVAADDASFANPVAHMSGVGVELLVEPWELGPRKAKEFLLLGETLSASAALDLGLVNRVVPRAKLADEARRIAQQVALVPAVTAEAIKRSINGMLDRMGQRDSWQLHFWLHQFVSNTPTALGRAAARAEGGMDAVRREQQGD